MSRKCFILIFVCAFVGTNILFASADDYISADEVASNYALTACSINQLSGNHKYSDGVNSIVLTPGMSRALVNGKLVILGTTPKFVNNKLVISTQALFLLDLAFKNTPQLKKSKKYFDKVVIDPGHGGVFTGAIGPSGVREKNVNLAVSKKLKNILEQNNIEVVMTRETDKVLDSNLRKDLKKRTEIANSSNADLFVSIHSNSSSSPSAEGYEIYYSQTSNVNNKVNALIKSTPANQPREVKKATSRETKKIIAEVLCEEYYLESKEIVKYIHSSMKTSLPSKDRGVKTANFYVIKWTSIPAILIELDFISNRKYEKLLNSQAYQKRLANAIATGILNYAKRVNKFRQKASVP